MTTLTDEQCDEIAAADVFNMAVWTGTKVERACIRAGWNAALARQQDTPSNIQWSAGPEVVEIPRAMTDFAREYAGEDTDQQESEAQPVAYAQDEFDDGLCRDLRAASEQSVWAIEHLCKQAAARIETLRKRSLPAQPSASSVVEELIARASAMRDELSRVSRSEWSRLFIDNYNAAIAAHRAVDGSAKR